MAPSRQLFLRINFARNFGLEVAVRIANIKGCWRAKTVSPEVGSIVTPMAFSCSYVGLSTFARSRGTFALSFRSCIRRWFNVPQELRVNSMVYLRGSRIWRQISDRQKSLV